jgi:hypothetical protein
MRGIIQTVWSRRRGFPSGHCPDPLLNLEGHCWLADQPANRGVARSVARRIRSGDAKKLAAEIQEQAFIDVPYYPLGINFNPTAFRSDLTGVLTASGTPLFWNVRREA